MNFQKNILNTVLFLVAGLFIYNKVFAKSNFKMFNPGYLPKGTDFYARIADNQFNAMRSIGTSESTLFSDLKGLSKEELEQVYNAFGTRTYSWFGQTGILSEWGITGVKLDLFTWYKKELNKKQLSQMRMVWKSKGVEASF